MLFLAALCVFVCTAVKAQSVVTLDLAGPAITRSSNWGSNPARTERNGAWWVYNFVGTSLDIKLYASQGYRLVNITLDGKSTTVDTSSPDSHVTSMDAMSVNDLAPTSHTLRLALIGPSPNGGTAPSGQVWLRINSISYTTAPAITPPDTTSEPPATSPSPTSLSSPSSSSPSSAQSSPTSSSTSPTPSNSSSSSSRDVPSSSGSGAPSTATETSPPSTVSTKSKTNIGAIIGGVLGGLALILAGAALFVFERRRNRRAVAPHEAISYDTTLPSPYPYSPSPSARREKFPLPPSPAGSRSMSRPAASEVPSGSASVRQEIAELRELITQIAHPPQYTSMSPGGAV